MHTCCSAREKSISPILKTGDVVAIDHSIKDPQELDKKNDGICKRWRNNHKWLKVLEDGIIVGVPENKDDFDALVHLKGKEINTGIVGKIAWWWAKRQ